MIFQDFSYTCPTNIQEAVALLSEPGVRSYPIAGGTDLTIALRNGSIKADRLVDITRIPELKTIKNGQHITIGAAATFTEIFENPILQNQTPLLVKASQEVGSDQIRNLGTIGGNVANAAICADSLPVLACLEANAVVYTPAGKERIPVSELITGPGRTRIPAGGLIQSFEIDPMPIGSKTAFQRIGRRKAMAIARLSLAALGTVGSNGKINQVRLVPGASFPQFRRVSAVENLLLGQVPDEKLFVAAGQTMANQFILVSGNRWSAEWKVKAIAAITERVLRQIFGGIHEN